MNKRKRFYIISFVVLPIIFVVGYYVSIKIAMILGYFIDQKGGVWVASVLLVLYLKCVYTLFKALLKH
jgi:hypothetical protein